MRGVNKVMIAGNLTRDPELRYTSSGTAVAKFGVAINISRKDTTSGEWREEVTFVEVEVWSKAAENAQKYLFKGNPVFIEARLKLDQWKTKDGQARQMLKIVADNIVFLGNRDTENQDAPRRNSDSLPYAEEERKQDEQKQAKREEDFTPPSGDDDIPF